jgi:hypothetical protein
LNPKDSNVHAATSHKLGNFVKSIIVGFFYAVTRVGVDLFVPLIYYKASTSPLWSKIFGGVFGWVVVSFLYYWILTLRDELDERKK